MDAAPPEPLSGPPLAIIQRLGGGTYAVVHDGVMWIRSDEEIRGFPLDQWEVLPSKPGVIHDGDELFRIRWKEGTDE